MIYYAKSLKMLVFVFMQIVVDNSVMYIHNSIT